jgi:hypothetical protein
MIDNTDCGRNDGSQTCTTASAGTDAIVRGLEVQAWSGSNTYGINTGIAGFGKTFGIHGATDATAGGISQPAAVFADLDNGSATTAGNAIRAYTDNATSANLVSFYQETSAFTGSGLIMNFGNNSGSFTGNFLNLQKAGTAKLTFDYKGQLAMTSVDADNAENVFIDTTESTGTQSVFRIQSDVTTTNQDKFHINASGATFVSFVGTQTSSAVCHANNGQTINDELVDCTGTPAGDFAEMYPVAPGIEVGDVLAMGTTMVNTYETVTGSVEWDKVKGQVTQLVKSTGAYQNNLFGVVSDNYADFNSSGYNIKPEDNPKSIALVGRVLVKVTDENGTIAPGDFLTSSATVPGYAMKATRPGLAIGQALEALPAGSATGRVMTYVHTSYYDPTMFVDANGNVQMQHGQSSTELVANTTDTTAYIITQQGSGDILQLNTGDVTRLLVKNDGATIITSAATEATEIVFSLNNETGPVLTVNARGDLATQGTIFIKDNTFAGSIATDATGVAEITFSYNLGTGKPVVQLTPESDVPVFAQVGGWKKDSSGNYTGFTIKTYGLQGAVVSSVVHYIVVGKQDAYQTNGSVIQVQSAPSVNSGPTASGGQNGGTPSGQVAGDSTPPPAAPAPEPAPDTSSTGGTDGAAVVPPTSGVPPVEPAPIAPPTSSTDNGPLIP